VRGSIVSKTHLTAVVEPKAYTIPMITAATGIGRPKIYEYISKGKLKVKQAGGRTLVLAKDLDEFLENLPEGMRPSHNPKGRAVKAA
jgi:excisionase family DNA binding protein